MHFIPLTFIHSSTNIIIEIQTIMTITEKLEERGKKRGREEARADLIKTMLKNGLSGPEIAKVADLDPELVSKVEKGLVANNPPQ